MIGQIRRWTGMDDSTRLEEKEAQEIPDEAYYHVPRTQEVEVFGQAADVLPYDRTTAPRFGGSG